MKELMEYREKLIKRLNEAAKEFRDLCNTFPDPFAKVEGEWTPHQIASHTRDVEREVYGMRIRRTLNKENPLFENFDPDGWMASHYNPNETMQNILDEFYAGIQSTCGMLNDIPKEGWSRTSRHEALGEGLTLQLWVERSLAHIEEHLASIKTAQSL